MNRTPAVPWCPPTLWIALVKIVFAGPGATVARLLISGYVAECPIRPRTETITMIIEKIASTP
jgi:hypothetical protein